MGDVNPQPIYALCRVHLERAQQRGLKGEFFAFELRVGESAICDIHNCPEVAVAEWWPEDDPDTIDTPVMTSRTRHSGETNGAS